MPVVDSATGQVNFLISDLAGEVILKVENRVSDTARANQWLVDALLEISGNTQLRDDFVELERTGPVVNLTGNPTPVQEYDESLFLPVGDVNTATLDFRIWTDFPTNTRWIRLDGPISYQRSDSASLTGSQPTQWYRFGGFIGFNAIPDQNYQVQARYLLQHPINDSNLAQTQILLPRDWNEILVLAAAQKGFTELMEYEKAAALHQLLYGDPKKPDEPGMIYARKKKRTREAFRRTTSLQVVKRRYSWGR